MLPVTATGTMATYRRIWLLAVGLTAYGQCMSATVDPETLVELISDCTELPDAVLHPKAAIPAQRGPSDWRVSDECLAQVAGIDDYGS
jgi:hypothetical protein